MESIGFVQLHRELMEKPIWTGSTAEQKVVLITLLMMANFKEKQWEWEGKKFQANPGQFVTSLDKIVEKCGKGITVQNVRSALLRFEKLEFLTNESTKTGRLITIVNWHLYQSKKETQQSNQQRPNKEPTPIEKGNKENKEKHIADIEEIRKVLPKEMTKVFKSRQKLIDAIKSHGKEKLIECINNYDKSVQDKRKAGFKDLQYMNESTFWNGRYIDYISQDIPKKEPLRIVEREISNGQGY